MRGWLNKYFNFSKQEFNGLIVLVILIGLVMAFPYVYDLVFPFKQDIPADRLAIQRLSVIDKRQAKSSYLSYPKAGADKKSRRKLELFEFDPNVIGMSDWQKLGLSFKQAQAVLNYRNKGGKFYKTEDLRKMYTISPQMYTKLAPFVKISASPEQSRSQNQPVAAVKTGHNFRVLPVIELNGADTIALDRVRGIGPAFARRIVKYRERLGGFCRKEQLLEVFGLDSLKFQEIKDQLSINAALIKMININTATLEDFKNNPYIRYKQVNALIEYRKQHGNYSNIADLKKVIVLTPEIVMHLAPYLSF